jgi:hypothetical protein
MRAGEGRFVLLLVLGSVPSAGARKPRPTKGWPVAEPHAVGLDPKVLDALDADNRRREVWLQVVGLRLRKDSNRWAWGGSGFGGQEPIVLPEYDLLLVFTGWNVFPDKPSLGAKVAIDRVVEAMLDGPQPRTR